MAAKFGPKQPITVDDLDFSDAPARGWERIVWFAETYLKVPKGTGAKGPFKLRDWQVDIVKQMFPADGQRPRQGLISLPRGNGKTGLAAVLALYALFADEEEGAQVLVVASDERQAGHVYRAAKRMIETSPQLLERTHFYADRIYLPLTDSEMRALPADVGALQGWDPTLMIIDELHVVTEVVWEAVTSASGKRVDSLTLAISTPADNTDSIMWKLVAWAREGVDPHELVYVEYAAPDGSEVDDESAWEIANPALDDFLARDALRAQMRTIRPEAFKRYRMGMWVGSDNAWLPMGAWADLAEPRLVGKREKVCLAFDGSASGDATVVMGCTVGPDPYVFKVGIWQNPNPGKPGWRVPREEVDKAVDAAFKRFNVVELAADPWGWRSEIEQWSKRHGERRVIEWNTAHAARMAPATDRLYQLVLSAEIRHDGDTVVASHFDHAVAKPTHLGDLISKDKKGSERKIDAAVAAIVAVDRAAFHSNRQTRTVSFPS